jgi:hypothetical protein
MTLNGLAVWTGLLCALLAFAALPMALFAAGSGHPGSAAAAALLSSLGVGVGVIAAVVHHDHRHQRGTGLEVVSERAKIRTLSVSRGG